MPVASYISDPLYQRSITTASTLQVQKRHIDIQVGWDLCVLATSHHSVHTYGTFGLWGSLLANGDVVVAKGRNQVNVKCFFFNQEALTIRRP